MNRIYTLLITLLLSTLFGIEAKALIPQPQSHLRTAASFLFTPKTSWEVENDEQAEAASLLLDQLNRNLGLEMPLIKGGKSTKSGVKFTTNPLIPDEGYRLTVDSRNVSIEASGHRGFVYALMTIRQLLPSTIEMENSSDKSIALSGCTIEDHPQLSVRALRLTAQSRDLTKVEILTLLDLMAIHKLNRLYWDEMAERVQPLSKADFHEIGNFAAARGIELSAEKLIIDEQLMRPNIDNTLILQPEEGGLSTLADIYTYSPGKGLRYSDQVNGIIGSILGDSNGISSFDIWHAFPNAAALAEIAWSNPKQLNWNSFLKRLDNLLPTYKALRIEFSTSMFALQHATRVRDGKVLLSLESIRPDLKIRYTTNGETPTALSPQIPTPFSLFSDSRIFAIAFQENQEVSDPLLLEFSFNKATAKPIFSPRTANPAILVDGVRGVEEGIQGWLLIAEPTQLITVDLQEMTRIQQVELGAIGADKIELSYSTDGAQFTPIHTIAVDPQTNLHTLTDFSVECRFVKLIVHGNSNPALPMRMDEIVIN